MAIRLRTRCAILALAIVACEVPPNDGGGDQQPPTLADHLDRFLSARDRAGQLDALRTAKDSLARGGADQAACARTAVMNDLGRTLDEEVARRLIEVIGLMRCSEGAAVLAGVVGRSWRARTALTRAQAMAALRDGVGSNGWPRGEFDTLAERHAADAGDLVRAEALAWLMQRPGERARWEGIAAQDPSPWVTVLAGTEVSP